MYILFKDDNRTKGNPGIAELAEDLHEDTVTDALHPCEFEGCELATQQAYRPVGYESGRIFLCGNHLTKQNWALTAQKYAIFNSGVNNNARQS